MSNRNYTRFSRKFIVFQKINVKRIVSDHSSVKTLIKFPANAMSSNISENFSIVNFTIGLSQHHRFSSGVRGVRLPPSEKLNWMLNWNCRKQNTLLNFQTYPPPPKIYDKFKIIPSPREPPMWESMASIQYLSICIVY